VGTVKVRVGEDGVDAAIGGGGVGHGNELVDDVEWHDWDDGGEAALVADLGGAEGVDGREVELALFQIVGRLLDAGLGGNIPLLPRGLGPALRSQQIGESPIPLRVLLGEQLVESIEDELGVEGIHGDRESTVSDTNR
jgi:hypothetical protein